MKLYPKLTTCVPHAGTQSKSQQIDTRNLKTPCILSNHCRIKLNINKNRNNRELTNSRTLNKSLLSEKWVKTEIKKDIIDVLELNENGNTAYTNSWYTMKEILF